MTSTFDFCKNKLYIFLLNKSTVRFKRKAHTIKKPEQ